MLIPNLTAEYEWRRWSAQLPIYYSDLNYFSRRVKFHTIALQPGVRYWFNSGDAAHGHTGLFAGVHFGVAWYNASLGGTDRYQDYERRTPAVGGGVEIGWRTAFGSSRRWKFELSIGGGAYSLHYDRFANPASGRGELIGSRRKTFIGVDNVGVSFGYSFDMTGKEVKR